MQDYINQKDSRTGTSNSDSKCFSNLEKYIQNKHTIDGRFRKISSAVEREIIDDFEYMLSLKSSGLNLFFTDIDYIKKLMLEENGK